MKQNAFEIYQDFYVIKVSKAHVLLLLLAHLSFGQINFLCSFITPRQNSDQLLELKHFTN